MRWLAIALAAGCTLAASPARSLLFQPDAATASSEFSGSYDIGNAIDGSGLPASFTPADAHATYVANNHWTTVNGDTAGAYADFTFTSPVTIGTFHLWNHRSNNIASNDDYEVTRFDLKLYDAADDLLFELLNQTAAGETAVAQSYAFAPVGSVARVRFDILETQQQLQMPANPAQYTGVAEVAFESVPEPGILALALLAVPALSRRLQTLRA